jgi:hypothetical protein
VSILKTFKPELTTKETKEIFKNNAIIVNTDTTKPV